MLLGADILRYKCGSSGRGRESKWSGRSFPMKKGIWEVGEGIRCSECTHFDGVHPRTSVVVQGWTEVVTSEPMMGPRGSTIRALMRHY